MNASLNPQVAKGSPTPNSEGMDAPVSSRTRHRSKSQTAESQTEESQTEESDGGKQATEKRNSGLPRQPAVRQRKKQKSTDTPKNKGKAGKEIKESQRGKRQKIQERVVVADTQRRWLAPRAGYEEGNGLEIDCLRETFNTTCREWRMKSDEIAHLRQELVNVKETKKLAERGARFSQKEIEGKLESAIERKEEAESVVVDLTIAQRDAARNFHATKAKHDERVRLSQRRYREACHDATNLARLLRDARDTLENRLRRSSQEGGENSDQSPREEQAGFAGSEVGQGDNSESDLGLEDLKIEIEGLDFQVVEVVGIKEEEEEVESGKGEEERGEERGEEGTEDASSRKD